jgi:hypothetical protein
MEAIWRDRNKRQKKKTHRVLVGKAQGESPLAVHCNNWEDDIKMDLKEMSPKGIE